MSQSEIEILKNGLLSPNPRLPIWQRAFEEYNADHPDQRPLNLNCRSCYYKVWHYLRIKKVPCKTLKRLRFARKIEN